MKKLHFIAQSKGGVGKSLLMYLMALKNYHKENCLFVDMDASTFTSRRQLSFVDEDKLDTVSLLNERAAIQRDNLLFIWISYPGAVIRKYTLTWAHRKASSFQY